MLALAAAEPRLADFYLTGGTALAAYYLGHRVSDDLDFFAFAEPDRQFLHAFANTIQREIDAANARYERLHDRSMFFYQLPGGILKVEFARYPFRQLEPPMARPGIRVDSLRDIAANKLMAILERFEPKDFVDLYFVLQQRELDAIRKDAQQKFGHAIGDLFLGGELAKIGRLSALPRMLKPLTTEELKSFFSEQARRLSSGVLEG